MQVVLLKKAMNKITLFWPLIITLTLNAQNESKLVVQAAPDQTNQNPLVRLIDHVGNDLLSIHSDDGTNVFFGNQIALNNYDGSRNVGIGTSALHANIYGSGNIAIGHQALFANVDGNDNVAIGPSALKNNNNGRNTAMGINALLKNTTGAFNTALGFWALSETTSSEANTALGYQAGKNFDNGYYNVFVGANVDVDAADYYNVVAIGQGTVVDDVNRVRIGNAATTSYGGWRDWTNVSDGRYKSDIQENVPGLDFILKLRPVTYHLQASALSLALGENHGEEWSDQMKLALTDKQKILQTGFVAQEVESVAQSIGYDFSGVDRPRDEQGIYGLRYAEFVVPLVKAVQELKDENERLREDNHLLRKTDDLLLRRLAQIETALGLTQELAASSKE